ncbi:hypothetical protein LAV84_18445 [Rhizobium sp. VS19-DR104.2]|uniref:hypothetical protein n=1 Tax=unclassified Rhizobium TaxID=2613769 RepID=UPI001CC761E1|nr:MULTISPECIES: hypothetical protein [unclassified Rhizobium]MBZ5761553.1 hypothetical protein [Rhizobium sp. VS19-DR96]MBZ5767501.1 hypothetical protein [Rhizobium sp. VS19-DR129.2]MBZ5775050.1 hypothetical protein [Rhizobium sp. VS19-DRK62.2]MBZ5785985.1 hypothetical protein [Rhizobium sp. VS19-DR121]MBZ5803411.1 hypothetical protein [Rhizobium sp. VS19-DR181]
MTAVLISLAAVIVIGFLGSFITALIRSLGGQTRDEEAFGAPEGASNFQFQCPNISGSKLSVRVSSKQSVSQDAG